MKTLMLTDRQMELLEGALLIARTNNADFRDKVLSPDYPNAIHAANERIDAYDRILFNIREVRQNSLFIADAVEVMA